MDKKIYHIVKEKLGEYGPGMCLAKWTQVTVHLLTGHTHSCHHPRTHKIPVEEIKVNPSALHNTSYKKELRKEMMTGGRPSECQYCWNIEDKTDAEDVFSDRIYKSAERWSRDYKDQVIDAGWTKDVAPSYLEVSFSYGCNFKCGYCSPEISSKWMEEINQFGPYPTRFNFNNLDWIKIQDKMPIPEREDNPYVDAFWQWWPDIYPTLHTFRITGGEPLMSKHTFKVLDYMIANPNTSLELGINSNLNVPRKLFDEFLSKIKLIQQTGAVKSITIYTSCEARGAQAEYIRYGMNYNEWIDNCKQLLAESSETHFSIMSTYNALSVSSYDSFLLDVIDLKKQFATNTRLVNIDIPYLRNPEFLTMGILTDNFLKYAESTLELMNNYKNYFTDKEIGSMQRVYSFFKSWITVPMDDLKLWRKDFIIFVDEHDQRRGTNFLKTFPEYADFYNLCKETYDKFLQY